MNYFRSQSTSRFSVNVPQSVLFSDNLVSLSDKQTRLEEIESALEHIFAVENQLTILETIKVQNMQREIKRIKERYKDNSLTMIELDTLRIESFQERIEEMYMQNTPSQKEFIYAEKLMQEKEEILISL